MLAFLRNDPAGMQTPPAQAMSAELEANFLAAQAGTEAFYGRWRRAQELTSRARALGGGVKEDAGVGAARNLVEAALPEAVAGYSEQARRDVTASLNLSRSDEIQTYAALALALVGDTRRADTIASELAKRNPLDTLSNMYWL